VLWAKAEAKRLDLNADKKEDMKKVLSFARSSQIRLCLSFRSHRMLVPCSKVMADLMPHIRITLFDTAMIATKVTQHQFQSIALPSPRA
jgi:hypothetical protein